MALTLNARKRSENGEQPALEFRDFTTHSESRRLTGPPDAKENIV